VGLGKLSQLSKYKRAACKHARCHAANTLC
jgi:hypothetical protein